MPTTAPIFVETDSDLGPDPEFRSATPEPPRETPDRVGRLEGEVAELRDTIARFAELVIGEVKGLRQSHAELPAFPPAIAGELPVTVVNPEQSEASVAGTELPFSRRPWLIRELLHDLGTTVRMYLDPRYRVRRATQILVPLLVLLFGLNCFFFNIVFHVEILSSALEKLVDVVLAVLLYKVVSREILRYRQVIAKLLAWQQYRERKPTTVVSSEPAMTRLEME
jgi:hypothetical protein